MAKRELTQEEIQALPQEVRAQIASQIRGATPSAQSAIEGARLQAIKEENPTLSAIFPRMAEAKSKGIDQSFGQALGSVASDIPSMVGRTVSAVGEAGYGALKGKDLEDIGRQYMETLSSPEGRGIVESIVKHPSAPIAAAMAPLLLPLAKMGLLGTLGAGAIEGAVIGSQTQAERYGQEEDFNPKEFAIDLGSSMLIPGGMSVIGKQFKKAAPAVKKMMMSVAEKNVNPILKGISSELSGVSKDALELASTKSGRKKMIQMAGMGKDIGDRILKTVDNIDQNFQYEAQLQMALADMPGISVGKVINSLEGDLKRARSGLQTGAKSNAGNVIERELNNLKAFSKKDFGEKAFFSGKFQGEKVIPANAFRNMRKDLDFMVSFDDPGSNLINDALMNARTQAKKDLIEAGKGTDYESIMKKYSETLDAREKFYDIIGTRSNVRERRIEGFVNNLFGKNKSSRVDVLSNLEQVLGKNFLEEIKLTTLANEMVKDGSIPFFASQTTGRTLRGDIGTGAQIGFGLMTGQPLPVATGLATGIMSSPKLAPRALQGVRGLAGASGQAFEGLSSSLSNPYIQRTLPALMRQPVQQGLGDYQ